MRGLLTALLFAAFLLPSADNAWGGDIERVISVLEAIKDRQESYNPIDVRYKVTRTYTRYWFASSQKIDPSDRRKFATLSDATTILRCEYSAKGDRLLSVVEGSEISAEGKVLDGGDRKVSAYDGNLFKSTGGDGKVVSLSRKKPSLEQPLESYNGERMLLNLLPSLKKGAKPDELTVTDHPGRVPGAALYFRIVFGKGDQESVQEAWVSSLDKSYGVLRYEFRIGGKIFHGYSNCEYKSIDGIWFPYKALYRNYYHNKDIHQLAREERLDVEGISFRGDEIPDSQFVIPVNGDTELLDRDRNNLRIVGTDKVDRQILEAVADVERERNGGGWRPWIYASTSLVLFAGATCFGIRIVLARWRRRNHPT
jgi:hypothetical protein